jgi:hypothetical protein
LFSLPIEIWTVIFLAALVYSLVVYKILRNSHSKPKPIYVVTISKEEAQKMEKPKPRPRKKKAPSKEKEKQEKPEPPKPQRLESCREGQFFGFLHDFPKEKPIPDNCLDCNSIITCTKQKAKT